MPHLSSRLADWPDLVAELDRWSEAGRVAALWWRDDDAVGGTAELTNLLRAAQGAPVALAVIPARASVELAAALRQAPAVAVLQHGWLHANRAACGRKSEYPPQRPAAVVAAEIAAGRARLVELFGACALPVFVPPWNRVAPELLPILAEAGIAGLSTMASTGAAGPGGRCSAGLRVIDVHLDLTDWKGGRGFVGAGPAIASLVSRLRDWRLGSSVPGGAIGILTHHLIMDGGTAEFLDGLVETVARHPAVRWADIAELLR